MATERAKDPREQRGRRLARVAAIERVGRYWVVPSQTSPAERYLVNIEDNCCTCPDYGLNREACKHIHAVLFWIAWGRDVANANVPAEIDVTDPVAEKRPTYAQEDWSTYNESQHNEADYVELLAHALCAGIEQPPRTPGPGRNACLRSDLAYASVIKIYTKLPGRKLQRELKRCAEKKHISRSYHENSIGKFWKDEKTTPLLVSLVEESGAPLRMIENGQYAIDSTWLPTCSYYRYYDFKRKKLKVTGDWTKLHIVASTASHGITAVSVSPAGDSPQLRALVSRTMERHDVRELSADKAYGSLKNREFLEDSNVSAYIPFKDNAVINPKSALWSKHLCEFLVNKEKFNPHYHRRSNVETVFSMIKRCLGPSVSSRNPTARINEVLVKCLVHNLRCLVKAIFVSGLAVTFWPELASAPKLKIVKP
jgi:hypothetical protein